MRVAGMYIMGNSSNKMFFSFCEQGKATAFTGNSLFVRKADSWRRELNVVS